MRRGHFNDQGSRIKRYTDLKSKILLALDPVFGAKLLPTNWIPTLLPEHNDQWVRKITGELARRPIGDTCDPDKPCPHKLLDFVVFSGKNPAEVRYYFRTAAGDRYLIDHGLLAGIRRPAGKNKHQALVDLWRTSLVLGLKDTTTNYRPWHKLEMVPEATRRSDHPFRLYLGKEYCIPDDAPFVLSGERGGSLFLFEMDCNSEQITKHDEKNTIEGKLEMYKALVQSRVPQTLYNVSSIKLVIVTVNEARRRAILKKIADVFGGQCSWILVGVIENFPKLGRTPPVQPYAIQPYHRAGHPPFSLATLSEVENA